MEASSRIVWNITLSLSSSNVYFKEYRLFHIDVLSNITIVWRNRILPLMILYLDVTAAGEQIRMSKLSEPHVKNTIV
jgi:hypothetical protein